MFLGINPALVVFKACVKMGRGRVKIERRATVINSRTINKFIQHACVSLMPMK
jgi:hypothetical protein